MAKKFLFAFLRSNIWMLAFILGCTPSSIQNAFLDVTASIGALAMPESVHLGTVTPNGTSNIRKVKFQSVFSIPVVIDEISTDSKAFEIVESTCSAFIGREFKPGDVCQLSIRFVDSTGVNNQESRLTIVMSGTDRRISATSKLTARVVSTSSVGAHSISFEPNSARFGRWNVLSKSPEQKFILKNSFDVPIYLGRLDAGENFAIKRLNCPVSSVALPAGAECEVSVSFAPLAAGEVIEFMNVSYGFSVGESSALRAQELSLSAEATITQIDGQDVSGALVLDPKSATFSVKGLQSLSRTLMLKNVSSQSLFIGQLVLPSAPFSVTSSTCSVGEIAPGATCSWNVLYSPLVMGDSFSALSVRYGTVAGGTTLVSSAQLTGHADNTMGQSVLGVAGANFHDFGNVLPNQVTADRIFEITNPGPNTIFLSPHQGVSLPFSILNSTCNAGTEGLPVGERCQFSVRYRPTSEGEHLNYIEIPYGYDSSNRNVSRTVISVIGRSVIPLGPDSLQFSSSPLDFGMVNFASTAVREVTLTNSSGANIYFAAPEVTSSDFSTTVSSVPCPIPTMPLPPQGSCKIAVSFTPSQDNLQFNQLRVPFGTSASQNSRFTNFLTLMGRAKPLSSVELVSSAIVIEPSPVTYRVKGLQSLSRTLSLRNTSSQKLYIGEIASPSAPFSITGSTCSVGEIAAGSSCTWDVLYSPESLGDSFGTLGVRYGNVPGGVSFSTMVQLNGKADNTIDFSILSVSDSGFQDFGNVLPGETIADKTFTLSNPGPNTIYLGSATGQASPFSISASTCSNEAAELRAGQMCQLSVRFRPEAEGNYQNFIEVPYGYDSSNTTVSRVIINSIGRSEIPVGPTTVQFSVSPLDFGMVNFGELKVLEVTLTNTSLARVYLGVPSVSPSDFSLATSSEPCPTGGLPLLPQGTCKIKVSFAPTMNEQQYNQLVVPFGTRADQSSRFFNFLTLTGKSIPSPPTNFVVGAVSGSSVSFSWSANSSTHSGVEIQRCDGEGCDLLWTTAATQVINSASTIAYTWAGLTNGGVYRFRVRNKHGTDNSEWLTGPSVMTFSGITDVDNGTAQPKFMSLVDCRTTNGVYVGISWAHLPTATQYEINYTSNGATETVVAPAGAVDKMVYGLKGSVDYRFSIRAVLASGRKSNNSIDAVSLTSSNFAPCVVLGQSRFTRPDYEVLSGGPFKTFFDEPTGKLFVAESSFHRVLIFNNGFPTTRESVPDVAVGQLDLRSAVSRYSGINTPTTFSLLRPRDVLVANGKLIIADSGHHRVLIWNQIPTSSGQPADVVLGQPNFYSRFKNGNCDCDVPNSSSMNEPMGLAWDGQNLWVADTFNNRVLRFDGIPTVNYAPANLVLGQPNFLSRTPNNGGASASTLNNPFGVWSNGSTLMISDTENHRVLVWNQMPDVNFKPADEVYGQGANLTGGGNFTTVGTSPGDHNRHRLREPRFARLHPDNPNQLFALDTQRGVVKVFNRAGPVSTRGNAVAALGSSTTDCGGSNGQTNQRGLNYPTGFAFLSNRDIVVADTGNNRLMKWTPPATMDCTAATVNLNANGLWGKGSYFVGNLKFRGFDAKSFFVSPENQFGSHIHSNGERFVLSDLSANRVLVWNSMPSSNLQPADYVLGAPDFVTPGPKNCNDGKGFDTVASVYLAGTGSNTRLLVGDNWCRKVFVFNLGSANSLANYSNYTSFFGSTTFATNKGPSAFLLSSSGATQGRLFVTDPGNHRVLVWNNGIPTTDNNSPNLILGVTGSNTPCDATRFNGPNGLEETQTHILVTDTENARILAFNKENLSRGDVLPEYVLGQTSFNECTGKAESGLGFWKPVGLHVRDGKLFVTDHGKNQMVIYNDISKLGTGVPWSKMFGQTVPGYGGHYNQIDFPGDTPERSDYQWQGFSRPTGVWGDLHRIFVFEAGMHWGHPPRVTIFPKP